jgi:hypothetical protein
MKDISMHLMDIVENSIRAMASTIEIDIFESKLGNYYRLRIKDNGTGMEEEFLERVTDPWTTTRTTRKVGLGLSLLKQNCERTGGFLTINSVKGQGTVVEAELGLAHLDRPPSGNIAVTLKLLIGANPSIRFIYNHHTDDGIFFLDTDEVHAQLEGLRIEEPGVLKYLQEMISENLEEIKIS